MRDYSKIRFSNFFINLTGKEFDMYDDVSGTIYDFPACDSEIPETPTVHKVDGPTYHYVVTEDKAMEIAKTGRKMHDIAVLKDISTGRGGAKIASLYWAANPDLPVRLYKSRTPSGNINI